MTTRWMSPLDHWGSEMVLLRRIVYEVTTRYHWDRQHSGYIQYTSRRDAASLDESRWVMVEIRQYPARHTRCHVGLWEEYRNGLTSWDWARDRLVA
jgi:hypothetical protein